MAHLDGVDSPLERPNDAIRRYDETKFALASIAQAGMQLCRELTDEEGQRLYQSLLAKIAEDRFNLAVLGSFNRGKSTLMNAILGMDRLPTGILPHTSVITTVTYGSQEQVLIRCAGWALSQKIPLEKLDDYITERGNPGNHRRATVAEIQLPAEILRRGLSLIDTPGIGSGIAANTNTTERFLPEIDGAIFVSSVESPIGETEVRFLRRIYKEVGKVFVVINKLDLLSEKDQREVLAFVNTHLEAELKARDFSLFAISAKSALNAKLRGDKESLKKSGLLQLEQAISEFLSAEKASHFCNRVLDRLAELLKRQKLEIEISLRANDREHSTEKLREDFKREIKDLSANASSIASSLRAKLSREIPKELRVLLDSFFVQLAESVRRRFLSQWTSHSVLFSSSKRDRLLREMATVCEQAMIEQLDAMASLAILPAIRKTGGQEFTALMHSADAVPQVAAKLFGREIEPARDATPRSKDEPGLTIPLVSHTPWSQHSPFWLRTLPLSWRKRRFETELVYALDIYRRQMEALIEVSVGRNIDDVARQVQQKINERAARIAFYINGRGESSQLSLIEELILRVGSLRQKLNNSHKRESEVLDVSDEVQEAEFVKEADITLGEELCPICSHATETLFAFLSKYQYSISAKETGKESHAKKGGFCSMHTWMYSEITSPQGICLAYPPLLMALSQKLLERLDSPCETVDLDVTLQLILRQHRNCPACTMLYEVEREAVSEVIHRLSYIPDHSVSLPILCLAHLQKVLAAGPQTDLAQALSRRTANGLKRCAENMQRYSLKHDGIRRNLLTHEERIAYLLGLVRVASDKGLAPRWHADAA
jgi:small GTP-binding protein